MMKKLLLRLSLILFLIILAFVMLPGCTDDSPARETTLPETTEFGQMLGFVPYSFLEEHDIWFGNPGAAKALYGLGHLNNQAAIEQIPEQERKETIARVTGIYIWQSLANYYEVAPLIGWDQFMVDRSIFNDNPPPWGFSVSQGNFDESLIGEKLTGQGYTKAAYGDYTYYWKNGDMGTDIQSEIGRHIMSQLNRVAVLDNTLVVAPATSIMTGVLDAMTGNVTRVIDNTACQALTDTLGDVFAAVLITPNRILEVAPGQTVPPFDLPTATDWNTLHLYDMIAMGYRDTGTERYWIISLYYADAEQAKADAAELTSRLNSYTFNSLFEQMENLPLTSRYEVGESVVKEYGNGATLTVSCRYLPEERIGSSHLVGLVMLRDLLFLAPDPTPYIKE
jgi:hypothetical protein